MDSSNFLHITKPPEVNRTLFSFLLPKEVKMLACTCKALKDLANAWNIKLTWKGIYQTLIEIKKEKEGDLDPSNDLFYRYDSKYIERAAIAKLAKINFNQHAVSKRQVLELFPLIHYQLSLIPELNQEQLYHCIPHFSQEHINLIALNQVRDFDFNKYPSLIPKLNQEQLYHCIPHFSQEHSKLIALNQVRDFDTNKYPLNRKQFENLIGTSDNALATERVQSLCMKQIHDLWYFSDVIAEFMSKEQLTQMDFKQYPLSQLGFNRLFPKIERKPQNKSKVEYLRAQQIFDCLDLFDDDLMDFITPKQVRKMDFSKLQHSQLLKLIGGLFSYKLDVPGQRERAIERLKMLSPEQLNFIPPDIIKLVASIIKTHPTYSSYDSLIRG